ncbi:MAG: PhoH family protein [Tannerellaceae bacterium]|jgi:PhoH-like ATPase|nr:PhoH family protein [Tannerellaceae bacterium]
MNTKKNFILDTNVILHDYQCLDNFQENDIYIPITVLEELDKFKKGSEQIHHNARAFVRALDQLSVGDIFNKGVSIGPDRGELHIVTGDSLQPSVAQAFIERTPDHRILSCAITIAERHPQMKTILVTKDINLRMKARALGMPAEDYTTDKVAGNNLVESCYKTIDNVPLHMLEKLYGRATSVSIDELNLSPVNNQCYIFRNGSQSALVRYHDILKGVCMADKRPPKGIAPRNAEQTFAFDFLFSRNISLIALTGKAGTGKTLLALAAALSQIADYSNILLARPIVALGNKDLGYLPGDSKQKISPYMQPLFDNLTFIKNQFSPNSKELRTINDWQQNGRLAIEALAYIRGRSLSSTYCIIDEAQNLTPHEIKTIITRAGEGTKIVFTGDLEQIDAPYLDAESNGLAYMIERMKGQDIFAHINLVKGERSQLSEIASRLL